MLSLEVCKYIIDDVTLIFEDGTKRTIPSKNVSHITIDKNFFDMYLPVFIVKCNVDYELYNVINKKKPKYRFNLKKFNIPSTNTDIEEDRILAKNFINGIFVNVNDTDNSPNLYENIIKEDSINGKDERPSVEKDAIDIELILFKENYLTDYRTLSDVIYNNTSVINVMMSLLMEAKQNKCLLSYPDNKNVYDNVIIPNNLTLIGAIEYVQNIYGIYNSGLCIFNDFNKLYLLNRDIKCNAYERLEYRIVYVQFTDILKAAGNIYGTSDDVKSSRYKITCASHPVVASNDTQLANLSYNEVMMIDTFTGKREYKKLSDKPKTEATTSVKILDNKYSNKYAINSMIYGLNLNNNVIEIEFNEVDLDILTPNKEFYIDFDMNSKDTVILKGLYKLVSYVAVFQKQDDNKFYNGVKATFKRA